MYHVLRQTKQYHDVRYSWIFGNRPFQQSAQATRRRLPIDLYATHRVTIVYACTPGHIFIIPAVGRIRVGSTLCRGVSLIPSGNGHVDANSVPSPPRHFHPAQVSNASYPITYPTPISPYSCLTLFWLTWLPHWPAWSNGRSGTDWGGCRKRCISVWISEGRVDSE